MTRWRRQEAARPQGGVGARRAPAASGARGVSTPASPGGVAQAASWAGGDSGGGESRHDGGTVRSDVVSMAAGAGRDDGTAASIAEGGGAAVAAGGGPKFAVVAGNRCGTAEPAAGGGKAAKVGGVAVSAGAAEAAGGAAGIAEAADRAASTSLAAETAAGPSRAVASPRKRASIRSITGSATPLSGVEARGAAGAARVATEPQGGMAVDREPTASAATDISAPASPEGVAQAASWAGSDVIGVESRCDGRAAG